MKLICDDPQIPLPCRGHVGWCQWCRAWSVAAFEDDPTFDNGIYAAQQMVEEALLDHVAECAPDLRDPAQVEGWLAS